MNSNDKLVIFAPGVHAGGGRVLIESLLNVLPTSGHPKVYLDSRLNAEKNNLPEHLKIVWTRQTFIGRFQAELRLRRDIEDECQVLCLHGLPPLLGKSSKIAVFILNRLHLGVIPLSKFELKTRTRLFFERIILLYKGKNINRYFVHTESTKYDLRSVIPSLDEKSIEVIPLVGDLRKIKENKSVECKKNWDFIYPSNGDWHKNHKKLLEAWVLLARKGLFPSLVVTISENHKSIIELLEKIIREEHVKITNLGIVPQKEIVKLYYKSRALIYPSMTEAYGLPLVEATAANLPVLAGELDYVRDICQPAETFDINSCLSIARAVERFLRLTVESHEPVDSVEFWSRFNRNNK